LFWTVPLWVLSRSILVPVLLRSLALVLVLPPVLVPPLVLVLPPVPVLVLAAQSGCVR